MVDATDVQFTITLAPAVIANAIAAATGVRLHETPMNPERVWRALNGGQHR